MARSILVLSLALGAASESLARFGGRRDHTALYGLRPGRATSSPRRSPAAASRRADRLDEVAARIPTRSTASTRSRRARGHRRHPRPEQLRLLLGVRRGVGRVDPPKATNGSIAVPFSAQDVCFNAQSNGCGGGTLHAVELHQATAS